ncbi:tRNA (adenosine(37)-N6)-threonylcarbamoyltransferase complex ATPase subunit type 1 TsaE [Apibacter sp.]|uniref:tRNA (adenosine(37)-N6)-threonylcarbamoyltransferase complex ATPase subunit type 1 TsaE n=1 Tax=Apibacter sp. TaxID=2023709 RepID=UPI0025CBB451|nr:tRNA (adenosine(37)-N6)-threonylcarbamoyltransferase complex ATPase subunit type 1 TsaE [Apibacter sp.]MCT6869029.1 tRNA (adenosine(37)-N6)-threonylcarbamoyltransferase complex ATPase subunit type 1 TsaE [Apibacter sp.]
MNFIINTFFDLERAAEEIISKSKYKIFTLNGNLGAGKTTLVKYLCKVLNCTDSVTSPTFSLVNEYLSTSGKIFHFDLYRINYVEELFNIGFNEYIDSDNYCFIEWPSICENELPEHHKILLNLVDQTRYITFN